MSNHSLVIIKVGTSVLQSDEGLDLEVIEGLARQIAALRSAGHHCVLVSSGAVGAGQSQFPDPQTRNPVLRQQILAAIGQVELMSLYRSAFAGMDLKVAQVLATKEDFRDRRHYINMKNCLNGLLNEGVLPIINENDVISLRELMFTDNDELAGLIASMLGAEKLVLLTNVAGVLRRNEETQEMEVLGIIEDAKELEQVTIDAKSKLGRGGMQSKLAVVRKMAGLGIECIIASGKTPDILTRLLQNGENIGTQIRPSKGVSTLKKWLSSVEAQQTQGSVMINEGALEALRDSEQANSLLPVGISSCRGKFSKGDVISVCREEGEIVGLGLAAYGAKELRKIMGKAQQKTPHSLQLSLPFRNMKTEVSIFSQDDVAELQNRLRKTKAACRKINRLSAETAGQVIIDLADLTEQSLDIILAANQEDLARMDSTDPRYDRLKLTPDRLISICSDLRRVAALPSPLNRVMDERKVESGLHLKKISVPIGVVGIIFESRPNVMFDVFALNFKAGNASVLKGGSDAHASNLAIAGLIQETLQKYDLTDALMLMPSTREALPHILQAEGLVDLIIPRGSQGLIDFVRKNALVPVIETGAGIVHTYVDCSADLQQAKAILHNAKTRRVSVCNALDTLLIHEGLLTDLPFLMADLADSDVQVQADERSFDILTGVYPSSRLSRAEQEDFGTEFLAMKMSVKTVANLDEALDHIEVYSSRHSEAIVAEDPEAVARFFQEVDAATVYANASTAFTDGGEFGLGAEIGISTQKLHARGPMGLAELTSYKWLVTGAGHIRKQS